MSDFVVAVQCVRSVRCDARWRGQLRRAGCVTVDLHRVAAGKGGELWCELLWMG